MKRLTKNPMLAVLTSSVVAGDERQGGAQLVDERFGRREMLDHVEDQHVVEVRGNPPPASRR